MNSLSCAELVRRVLAGTCEAFGVLYGRYYDFIRNCCFKIVKNPEEARDIAQATFLRALEKIQYFRPESGNKKSFRKWVWRIAFNQSIDYLRFESREKETTRTAFEKGNIGSSKEPDPGKSVQDKERRGFLLETISRLPEITKKCVVSHYLLGLTYNDTAIAHTLTINQVLHQLDVGRRVLRGKLRGI